MSEPKLIGWVVLRQIDSNAESVGTVIQIHDTPDAAKALAEQLAIKSHGQKYLVAKIVYSALMSPSLIVQTNE